MTGTFADVLNWAGESEDDFNAKLEAANSTAERAQIVLAQLSSQNLPDAGQAWRDANEDVIKYNESQQNVDDAMAKLGERLAPVAAGIKNTFAGAVNIAIDTVEGWIEALQGAVTWLGNVADKIPVIKEIGDRAAAAKAAYDANPSRNSRSAGYARLAESRANDRQTGPASQTINVKSTVVLDGRQVGESVSRYQQQRQRAFR